jgi:hypothetical protein
MTCDNELAVDYKNHKIHNPKRKQQTAAALPYTKKPRHVRITPENVKTAESFCKVCEQNLIWDEQCREDFQKWHTSLPNEQEVQVLCKYKCLRKVVACCIGDADLPHETVVDDALDYVKDMKFGQLITSEQQEAFMKWLDSLEPKDRQLLLKHFSKIKRESKRLQSTRISGLVGIAVKPSLPAKAGTVPDDNSATKEPETDNDEDSDDSGARSPLVQEVSKKYTTVHRTIVQNFKRTSKHLQEGSSLPAAIAEMILPHNFSESSTHTPVILVAKPSQMVVPKHEPNVICLQFKVADREYFWQISESGATGFGDLHAKQF